MIWSLGTPAGDSRSPGKAASTFTRNVLLHPDWRILKKWNQSLGYIAGHKIFMNAPMGFQMITVQPLCHRIACAIKSYQQYRSSIGTRIYRAPGRLAKHHEHMKVDELLDLRKELLKAEGWVLAETILNRLLYQSIILIAIKQPYLRSIQNKFGTFCCRSDHIITDYTSANYFFVI